MIISVGIYLLGLFWAFWLSQIFLSLSFFILIKTILDFMIMVNQP